MVLINYFIKINFTFFSIFYILFAGIEDTVHVVRPKPTAPIADFAISEKSKKTDVSSEDQAPKIPKLLRAIATKRSRLLPIITRRIETKPQEPAEESFETAINAIHEEIPPKKVISQVEAISQKEVILQEEAIPPEKVRETPIVKFREEIKTEEPVVPEISVGEIKVPLPKDVIDVPDSVVDKDAVSKDPTDAVTEFYVPCPRKMVEEKPQRIVPCKCDQSADPFDCSCSAGKSMEVGVPCPQKKQCESIACKCRLQPPSNDCSKLIIKCTKHNYAFDGCVCKVNGLEQRKDCAHCHSSIEQSTCVSTQYLRSYLKTNKPKFRDVAFVSPLRDPHIVNCYREREECRGTPVYCRLCEVCGCKCTVRNNCLRRTDKRDCK